MNDPATRQPGDGWGVYARVIVAGRHSYRTCFLRIVALTFLAASAGCSFTNDSHFRLSEHTKVPRQCAVIFLVDGMSYPVMKRMLADGELPHIRERFVERGVEVEHAVSTLPPITYAAITSLLTGRFPGHHGILGNRWFDRETLELRSYMTAASFQRVNRDFAAPTFYEMLDDALTINVQCHTRRGVTRTIDELIPTGIDWALGTYERVDRRVGSQMRWITNFADRDGRWPLVILLYFPGVDEIAHLVGVDSERYTGALRNIDAQIGRVIEDLGRSGVADKTTFVLLSDHGHVQTPPGRTVDLAAWLRDERGLRVRHQSIEQRRYETRRRAIEPFDVVLIDDANRRAVIHLRGDDWTEPVTSAHIAKLIGPFDRAGALTVLPGVGLVCFREGPGRVRVLSRGGTLSIERREDDGVVTYRLNEHDSGADILRYRDDAHVAAFIDAGWHTSREWLAATAESRYPDFVPQVIEMFDSRRAGDVVVFAESDYSFHASEPSGHGSALGTDLRIPMYFAGEQLPDGASISPGRIVDVLPTLLEMLGYSERLAAHSAIDGVSLADALRTARRKQP